MFQDSRTFKNELGNDITIELEPSADGMSDTIRIIGPTSTGELILTSMEVSQLFDMMYVNNCQ